jgi:hypothetical protein
LAFYRHTLLETAEPVSAPEFEQVSGVQESSGVYQSSEGLPSGTWDQDWEWPWIAFRLDSAGWPSGVYFAAVYEVGDAGEPLDSLGHAAARHDALGYVDTNAAMFVVTPREPTTPIAYIVPIATYHAYNLTGGGCFYRYYDPDVPASRKVTMRRPGAGIGGESREPRDPYDEPSPRQAFAHWDAKMIGWLRRQGFAVDCYTDLDLDQRDFLSRYRLMISAGHHEYWSEPMCAHVKSFLDAGGNVAIFSGNTCYRKISFDAAEGTITKENEAWPESNEARLVGVSYSEGGGWWGLRREAEWYGRERPALGYTVFSPGHWVFAGVPLAEDGTFGAPERLVGYECDGVVAGMSPANVTVLACAKLTGGWNNGEGHVASMVFFRSGRGRLFNAATTDWARILSTPGAESYPAVSRITSNVVTELSRPRSSSEVLPDRTPATKTFRGELTRVRDLLSAHTPFALARVGHGELEMLQGKLRRPGDVSWCREYRYAPADPDNEGSRRLLWDAFTCQAPHYLVGINCPHCVSDEEFDWLRARSGQPEDRLTFSTLYFYSNYEPYLSEVVPLYREYDTVLVCHENARLDRLPFTPHKDFRNGYNAWMQNLSLIDDLKAYITRRRMRGGLFLFCCGALGTILAHQLYAFCPENTYLDIGSSLDPYFFTGAMARTRGYLLQTPEEQAAESCYWPPPDTRNSNG